MNRAKYDLNRYYERRSMCIERLGGKCFDCGSKDNLQFDHVVAIDKLFDISQIMLHGNEKLFKELEKCVLRCAECHKIKSQTCVETGGGHNKVMFPVHGTAHMYHTYGCRCNDCRFAKKLYRMGAISFQESIDLHG